MIRTIPLAAALAALAMPAAAASVSADAFASITVLEAAPGIEFSYEPLPDSFADAFGNAEADASITIDTGETSIDVAAETQASAAPVGDAFAEAFSFDPVFADNLADAAGSVTFRIDYDLAVGIDGVGPGEIAFGFASFAVYELLDGAVDIVFEQITGAGDLGDLLGGTGDLPPSATGAETFTIDLDPFESRTFEVAVDTVSVAVSPIPLPAGGWLLLGGLAALGLRRRG